MTVIPAMMLCVVLAVSSAVGGEVKQTLVKANGGGWQTVGLPYAARISQDGLLTSLVINGDEYIAPFESGVGGMYMADGNKRASFSSVNVSGNELHAECEYGWLKIRFTDEGLDLVVKDGLVKKGGHILRMDLNRNVTRMRALGKAIEYDLPLKSAARSSVRVIGPNGSSISFGESQGYHLSASYRVEPRKDHYEVRFPWVLPGAEMEFSIGIAAEPRPEDGIKVSVDVHKDDFTFWSDDAQQLTTTLSNVDPEQKFEATMVLKIRSYLTKEVVQEKRKEIILKGGEVEEMSWDLAGLDPMLYIAELWVERGDEMGLYCSIRFVFNASKLLAPDVPEDFDEFWARTLEEQKKIPLDLNIKKVKEQGKHEVYKFSFAGLLGYRCYGWLTLPRDKTKKWPAVLVLPPAGMRGQPIPIFPGKVGMRININTVDVDLPSDQYDTRTWPAPYLATGMLDRDYYCLRFGYAAIVRAAEILAARPEVDSAHIRVEGSSQGGGLTFIAAGLYDGFESANAVKPGLCRLDWNLDYLQPPFFPIAVNEYIRPQVKQTLRYFLPSHFARRIKCPITVSLGLYDDVTPSVGVFCAYNAIPIQEKRIIVSPYGSH